MGNDNSPPITVYPVPLRPGFSAQVQLPDDMTTAEAEKICRVIMALAQERDATRA